MCTNCRKTIKVLSDSSPQEAIITDKGSKELSLEEPVVEEVINLSLVSVFQMLLQMK
jgi:hypothetical protein